MDHKNANNGLFLPEEIILKIFNENPEDYVDYLYLNKSLMFAVIKFVDPTEKYAGLAFHNFIMSNDPQKLETFMAYHKNYSPCVYYRDYKPKPYSPIRTLRLKTITPVNMKYLKSGILPLDYAVIHNRLSAVKSFCSYIPKYFPGLKDGFDDLTLNVLALNKNKNNEECLIAFVNTFFGIADIVDERNHIDIGLGIKMINATVRHKQFKLLRVLLYKLYNYCYERIRVLGFDMASQEHVTLNRFIVLVCSEFIRTMEKEALEVILSDSKLLKIINDSVRDVFAFNVFDALFEIPELSFLKDVFDDPRLIIGKNIIDSNMLFIYRYRWNNDRYLQNVLKVGLIDPRYSNYEYIKVAISSGKFKIAKMLIDDPRTDLTWNNFELMKFAEINNRDAYEYIKSKIAEKK